MEMVWLSSSLRLTSSLARSAAARILAAAGSFFAPLRQLVTVPEEACSSSIATRREAPTRARCYCYSNIAANTYHCACTFRPIEIKFVGRMDYDCDSFETTLRAIQPRMCQASSSTSVLRIARISSTLAAVGGPFNPPTVRWLKLRVNRRRAISIGARSFF